MYTNEGRRGGGLWLKESIRVRLGKDASARQSALSWFCFLSLVSSSLLPFMRCLRFLLPESKYVQQAGESSQSVRLHRWLAMQARGCKLRKSLLPRRRSFSSFFLSHGWAIPDHHRGYPELVSCYKNHIPCPCSTPMPS